MGDGRGLAESEATRKATRDYRSLSDTPWDLWRTVYARRSHRKYVPHDIEPGFAAAIEETVANALGARQADGKSVLVATDPEVVDEVRRRSYKGLPNKINLWLRNVPVAGFLVMALAAEDVVRDRPAELPRTSMAVEDTVLWLTERGLGTCWLGGVNQREIRKIMGLDPLVGVPAVVCLGKPKEGRQAGYDALMSLTVSKRRKQLTRIASNERMDTPYTVPSLEGVRFQASPVQDVRGLLDLLAREAPGSADVPLDLVIDACLEAARVAPSGGNAQRWHFAVVRDTERLEELVRSCGARGSWRAGIVGLGYEKRIESVLFDKPFWMIDVPIALSHMSLMARSGGCGVVTVVDGIDERAVNDLVGASGGARTVGVVGIF